MDQTSENTGAVLLTGASGFVGMELLARYLERGHRRVIALVRASSDAGARARIDALLSNLFGSRGERYAPRVEPLAADLTAPRLGLAPARFDSVAQRATTIVHCAASVSFAISLEEARKINLEGTGRVLELADRAQEHGGLERYAHVSTAYVAGTHDGRFSESDLDLGQGFHNPYEQSKFEAEQLVHSHRRLPATILRPSIIVGDRRSGWTAAFNVLYWPLRAFSRGLIEAVPGIPSAPVDVVSIDYVADAIHELCEKPGGTGATYHLAAGAHASTIGEIALLASRYFRRPLPKVLAPDEFAAEQRSSARLQALESSYEYFPYFSMRASFDDAAARARLQSAGITASPLREYLDRLLDFATASRWGKRPIARVTALAA